MKRTIIIASAIILFFWLSFSVYALQNETFTRIGRGVVYDATFSPDSKILAVSTSRGIYFHNPADFTELAFIDSDEIPVSFTSGLQSHSVCFSPDGKLLASVGINRAKTIIIWDTATLGKVVEIVPERYSRASVYSLRFSPDGKSLAFGGGDGTVRFLDIAGRKEIDKIDSHEDSVSSICFSPDGSLLASISKDNTAKLWDLATRKVIKTFRRSNYSSTNNVVFSPDGKILAIGENSLIRLYDIEQNRERIINSGDLFSCPTDFSPDGKLIASGCVKLWDVDELRASIQQPAVGYLPCLTAIRFSPDGHFLVCVGNGRIAIWDMQAQREVNSTDEYICGGDQIAISSDSLLLATSGFDEFVKLWDIESGKIISRYKTKGMPWGSTVMSVSISPDNRLLAVACLSGDVMVWTIEDNKEFEVFDEALAWVNTVAFSPDSKLLVAGGSGGLKLWNMQTRKEIPLDEDAGYVWCVDFSPDGKYMASSNEDKIVHIWDMKRLKIVNTLRQEFIVYDLEFSPDGRWLGLGVSGENPKARILDTFQFKEVSAFDAGVGRPDVAFNSKGCLLAIGCYLKVELWDVAKHIRLATFPRDIYVMDVCFSPDDRFLAISTFDGVILWDMQPYADICNGQSVDSDGNLPITWGKIKQTEIYQNYPNPFNPETWIPYQLAEASDVNIDIYDTSGHLVRSLSQGRQEAGVYIDKAKSAYWDGRNDKGEIVTSGVYFYILRANSQKSSPGKMIVIK